MAKIEDLLDRRPDLSTYLVHLTRRAVDGTTAQQNLMSIIMGGEEKLAQINARTALGPARQYEDILPWTATQKVVCFTETPLEHLWMMLEDIDGRSVKLEPWGLVLPKVAARDWGCNPVWYVNTYGKDYWKYPKPEVERLIQQALDRNRDGSSVDTEGLGRESIFKITPFIEYMGPLLNRRMKEFWWEREWRKVGDLHLGFPSQIKAIVAPEESHEELRGQLSQLGATEKWLNRPLIDARWDPNRLATTIGPSGADHFPPLRD